jgi:hypothetical protein
MVSLIERLGTKAVTVKKETSSIGVSNPSAEYALSKVAERLLSTGMKTKESKWQEEYHLTPLRDLSLEQNGYERMTPQQRATLDAGKADLCLVALHKGILRVLSHLQLEEYWNVIGEKERIETYLVRDFWLGYSFNLDLKTVRDLNAINQRISKRLIDDIKDMVTKLKTARECEANNQEIPRESKIFKIKREVFEIEKSTWLDRVYHDWSGVGMDKTTYLHLVVDSLANGLEIPASIPDTVLNPFEKEQLNNLFARKEITKPKTAVKEA